MKSPQRELEVKLELTPAQMRRCRARLRAKYANAMSVENLHTIYFDTPERALRAEGLALRVRRNDDCWIQALKAERGVVGGISNPVELEAEVSGCAPSINAVGDKNLRRRLARIAPAEQLAPLFETIVRRCQLSITSSDGDVIEVALDEGTVKAASRKQVFREAEIELKSGNPVAMLTVVREIVADGSVRPSRLGKADRGYRMLGEPPSTSETGAKAEAPSIDPGMTAGETIVEICLSNGTQSCPPIGVQY